MKILSRITRCLLPAILLVALTLPFMPAIPAQAATPEIWEYYNAGEDAEVISYLNIWSAQSFTVGTEAHTVSEIRLNMDRTLLPGIVTISIQGVDGSNKPDGVDLTIGTIDGDAIGAANAWYGIDVTPYSLEAGTQYAIVIRALTGSASNHIDWNLDESAATYAGGSEINSSNGGVTWTIDAGDDFMFEIWGEPVISVEGAQVFSGYIETGDWLIPLTYKNSYPPYYPNENTASYFYIQLLDGAVVKAQTSCLAWDYRPGSIYLSKDLADTLEWGATDYKIRLYADFGSNPYAEYTILAADWQGADLEFLDTWIITQAKSIQDEEDTTLVTTITDKGEVLNSAGRAMFTLGIYKLGDVRPGIFEYALHQTEYEENTYTGALQAATDWEIKVGTTFATMLNNGGLLLGITGKEVGAYAIGVFMLIIIALLAMKGYMTIGVLLAYVLMLLGAWLGFIDYILLGVVTLVLGGGMFVYKAWLAR